MRSLLRHAALFSFAVSLGFFCSCERHRAAELPEEPEHEKSGAPDAHDRGQEIGNEVKTDTAQGSSNEEARPAGTPAEFFPATSPSPR
jgi:hypothetical protein